MIAGLIRLAVFGLIGLTFLYVLISLYSRSVRREKLEKQWDAGEGAGDRDAFIDAGLRAYRRSLRRQLIWLVYVLPIVGISVLTYVLNFS